ncbi:hypothetical protein [Bacterioplanoides pacificum]|uniref:7-cyano-7-deazaguanine synthase n=1 Tax=Bacterioplanoides pacificum TaxID=1171596 RepID=A0ABV7VTV0_9GAMM
MKNIVKRILKSEKKLSRDILKRISHYENIVRISNQDDKENINVYSFQEGNKIYVSSGEDTFYFESNGPYKPEIQHMDFVAWIFLPVAMSKKKDLVIHGSGTQETKKNAERLSDIWACWLPKKYYLIKVHFKKYRQPDTTKKTKELLLFSGGVDSTYAIINKSFKDKPDLLTIQGMDYRISDQERFKKSIAKTNFLADQYADQRLMIRSNAYDVYKKYSIPPRLTFVFVLASASFLFSKSYRSVTMAADFALYQQFEELPYGSSIATDQLYSSGDFSLETYGNDVTRAEKLPSIMSNKLALKALSLCKDKKIRPENCGICSKCTRTKYMMLAATGVIPTESFINPDLDLNAKINFNDNGDKQDAYIKSTYTTAFRNNNLKKIPNIVAEYKRIIS